MDNPPLSQIFKPIGYITQDFPFLFLITDLVIFYGLKKGSTTQIFNYLNKFFLVDVKTL